ncbi:thiamine phosphate synthase [Calidifontibacter sp. DB0510]|uniref:Thiamine-phosphate synthase n=1 Tax=Metallococcus carri TaxID=1656884 RepID=A0A967B1Y1_9MICO|nr:thiamine phosphate synthase [Metallococcus carri]NHN57329.1 thiamine phosphate synthase [Metallococcus carri]NOP38066.1 thiamine phosphate synthase [Calidifontibacter sp. DB2511S]
MPITADRPARVAALADAQLYLCTDARREQRDFGEFVRAAYAGGVDVIQLRDKEIEAADELELLGVLAEEARAAGRLFSANDRADIATLSRADVLHVGQRDLTPTQLRELGLTDVVVGLSTHNPDQLAAAEADPQVDYFCTGPVWATPTKPGRTAVGLDLVRAAAATGTSKPWFAIGGIDESNVEQIVEAGARRIVVVRAITAATDPAAAAQRLRSHLPSL